MGALGDDTETLGEIYDGRVPVLAARMKASGVTQAFDFPLHFALIESLCGKQPMNALAAVLAQDRLHARPENLLTFLDNHDRPRLLSACGDNAKRAHQALSVLFALRGTPVITYGTESGLRGAEEPANRADMRFEPQHPTARHLRQLVTWRAQHPVLADGKTTVVEATEHQLVLLRHAAGEAVLVGINRSAKPHALAGLELPQGLAWATKDATRRVEAFGVRLEPLRIQNGRTFQAWLNKQHAAKDLEFRLKAPNQEGELVVVGSAPELGSWQPQNAPKLKRQGDRLVARVRLPGNGVVGFKVASVEGQEVIWAQGPNHYMQPHHAPKVVELTW